MLTDNRIKLLDFHFVRHVFLFFVVVVVTGSRRRYELNLVSHRLIPLSTRLFLDASVFKRLFHYLPESANRARVPSRFYTRWPWARRSVTTCSIPSLSIIRMPFVETLSFTKRFSLSSQNRCC